MPRTKARTLRDLGLPSFSSQPTLLTGGLTSDPDAPDMDVEARSDPSPSDGVDGLDDPTEYDGVEAWLVASPSEGSDGLGDPEEDDEDDEDDEYGGLRYPPSPAEEEPKDVSHLPVPQGCAGLKRLS